jgi:hypothetical protein
MTLLHAITHPARIHDVLFAEHPADGSELLLVAAENKKVAAYTISAQPSTSAENEEEAMERSSRIFAEFIGHSNRYVPDVLIVVRVTNLYQCSQSQGNSNSTRCVADFCGADTAQYYGPLEYLLGWYDPLI